MKKLVLITAYDLLIGEVSVPYNRAVRAELLPTSGQVVLCVRIFDLNENVLYWIQDPGESIRAYRPSSRSDPNYSSKGEDPVSQQAILIEVFQRVCAIT